mmetsp:Transcript_89943/g.259222  ORF Transcript_89943/g.259222 Transcript_89943/m.259222 type:complete len:422 (-) Transcript_89943:296-1561(-)
MSDEGGRPHGRHRDVPIHRLLEGRCACADDDHVAHVSHDPVGVDGVLLGHLKHARKPHVWRAGLGQARLVALPDLDFVEALHLRVGPDGGAERPELAPLGAHEVDRAAATADPGGDQHGLPTLGQPDARGDGVVGLGVMGLGHGPLPQRLPHRLEHAKLRFQKLGLPILGRLPEKRLGHDSAFSAVTRPLRGRRLDSVAFAVAERRRPFPTSPCLREGLLEGLEGADHLGELLRAAASVGVCPEGALPVPALQLRERHVGAPAAEGGAMPLKGTSRVQLRFRRQSGVELTERRRLFVVVAGGWAAHTRNASATAFLVALPGHLVLRAILIACCPLQGRLHSQTHGHRRSATCNTRALGLRRRCPAWIAKLCRHVHGGFRAVLGGEPHAFCGGIPVRVVAAATGRRQSGRGLLAEAFGHAVV